MQPRLSVSEATALVKTCIADGVPPLWVEGEVSNFIAHTSGHFYFSLKDSRAQLRCAMFRGANARLRFHPADGMQCAAFGRVSVYERSGQYQLIVERLQPLGEGELQAAFEALKARLAAEGLFAPKRKRPLPAFPRVIGVVTSPTGAAIRDIIKVLRRRWPPAQIVLRPARVQGPGAAEEIAAAIAALCRSGQVEMLIVGRGGGSLEDLWAFNEEVVARAIAAATIPVVSAVGHQIDFTIADFVADLRAPTPSAGAELAVPDVREVWAGLRLTQERAQRALQRRIESLRLRLAGLERSHALRAPVERLQQESQRADEMLRRATGGLQAVLGATRDRLQAIDGRLVALSPLAVLQRGYALAFDAGGRLLRSAAAVGVGDALSVELPDGALQCRVTGRTPGSLAGPRRGSAAGRDADD